MTVALSAVLFGHTSHAFDRQKWNDDFTQLKLEFSRTYSNLDDIVAARKLDLLAMVRRTEAGIGSSESDEAAARALRRFLDEFRDGHLRILAKQTNYEAGCRDAVADQVREELSRTIERQIRALQERGVRSLVIDITGNGVGSNCVEVVARMFASPGLKSPEMNFIEHPHWQRRFDSSLQAVNQDLRRDDITPDHRTMLREARERLTTAKAIAAEKCDRTRLWEGERTCSLLASGALATSGPYASRPKPPLDGLESAWVLFSPHQYLNLDGVCRQPLAVLVDENTASAAEQFAAMLKDNGSATLIGRKTLSAGCGYTDGGITITLQNSKARIRVPDCARMHGVSQTDRSNEVLGLKPDLETKSSSQIDYIEQVAKWSKTINFPK